MAESLAMGLAADEERQMKDKETGYLDGTTEEQPDDDEKYSPRVADILRRDEHGYWLNVESKLESILRALDLTQMQERPAQGQGADKFQAHQRLESARNKQRKGILSRLRAARETVVEVQCEIDAAGGEA